MLVEGVVMLLGLHQQGRQAGSGKLLGPAFLCSVHPREERGAFAVRFPLDVDDGLADDTTGGHFRTPDTVYTEYSLFF